MSLPDVNSETASLRRILEVARQLSAPFELRELLSEIIGVGCDILRADRGSVFLFDDRTDELYTVVATGVDEMREIRFGIDKGIAGECARTRQIVNVPDCYADPRFNQDIDKETGYHTRCLITVPLIGLDDELVGVIQLLNAASGAFTEADENMAVLVASQAATAIQRVRLLDDRLERMKLERELDLARTIQLGLLPAALPACEGYDLATYINPAEQTGGDIYDLVPLVGNGLAKPGELGSPSEVAETTAVNSLFLLLADATGHGVGPALSVTQVRAMLRVGLRMSATLDELFRHINCQLTADLAEERFVTAFLGVLNPTTHEIAYHSAGQAPLLHYHAKERRCEFLDATTIPMGILDDPPIEPAGPMRLDPGDFLVLFTDGVYECQNDAGKQLGSRRVGEVIDANRAGSAQDVLDAVLDEMRNFVGGQPQLDDVTAVIVKRKN